MLKSVKFNSYLHQIFLTHTFLMSTTCVQSLKNSLLKIVGESITQTLHPKCKMLPKGLSPIGCNSVKINFISTKKLHLHYIYNICTKFENNPLKIVGEVAACLYKLNTRKCNEWTVRWTDRSKFYCLDCHHRAIKNHEVAEYIISGLFTSIHLLLPHC